MAYQVEYSAEAEGDLSRVLEWLIAEHAGETGLRWFEGLEEAITSLRELPQRCPLAPEYRAFPFEVRHLLYGHRPHIYRILFAVEGDVVLVLHIWHGRRKPLTQ